MSGKFGGPIFCIYKYDMLPSINSNCDCELLYECYFLSHLMVVRVISFEEMKISFSNCLPCLLVKIAKMLILETNNIFNQSVFICAHSCSKIRNNNNEDIKSKKK